MGSRCPTAPPGKPDITVFGRLDLEFGKSASLRRVHGPRDWRRNILYLPPDVASPSLLPPLSSSPIRPRQRLPCPTPPSTSALTTPSCIFNPINSLLSSINTTAADAVSINSPASGL